MKPLLFLPIHPVLTSIIESIVIAEMDFSESKFKSEYKYPWTAKASIFFTVTDEPVLLREEKRYIRMPLSYIVGPRLINDTVDFGKKRKVVGISFKAGGFRRLMKIPVYELTKENIDLHQMFGKETEVVEERLKEAKDNKAISVIIENFLLKRVQMVPSFSQFDLAIQQAVQCNGNTTVGELALTAGISNRQFERKCHENLGVHPKLFTRMTRFTHAYILKENNPSLSWLDIAYEVGYFDQMHLIRDFKKFSGYTPSVMNKMLADSVKIMTALKGSDQYR